MTRNEDDDSACILIHIHRDVLGPDVSAPPSTLRLVGGAATGESFIISAFELLVQAEVNMADENGDLKRLRLAATLNEVDLK